MRAWLLAVALVGAACREQEVADGTIALQPGIAPAPPPRAPLVYPSVPASFVDVVASARHAVVAIRATTPVKSGPAAMFPGSPETVADVALGTGFLIEARGVFVLTNDHIAAAATALRVALPDGTEVPAKVIGRDPRLDIALLEPEGAAHLHPLAFGESSALAVGEWLVVLGNPFGSEVTASAGIVSATGREAPGSMVMGRTSMHRSYLQTDARIHRGNAGGPVLNTAGQVVGVAVTDRDRPGELSFVIPIDRVKDVLVPLREHGQVARGWLGVLANPVTAELAGSLGLPAPTGAIVTEVKAGSPAARSAIRVGDVVLSWGGTPVDHRSLPWLVAGTPVGRPVEVVVWRNRAETRLAVFTEKMPE